MAPFAARPTCENSPAPRIPSICGFFLASDQAVAAGMLKAHVCFRKIMRSQCKRASAATLAVLDFHHVNKGGATVNLALKLNMLAVCVVFAFVGAVLFGAF
ncbi:MAG: hypothetical protein Q8M26_12920 [Pseudolabrys sp.]|nr:hypothetical protein [Pseudolabrys sp.]